MALTHYLRQFISSFMQSGLATAAKAISIIVVNKLFAVAYGPNGITLISHFLNLIGMLTALSSSGINDGALRNMAQYEPTSKPYQIFFWTGLWLNVLSTSIGVLLVFLFPGFFLERFSSIVQEGFGASSLFLSILLLFLFVLQLYWQVVLLAQQALKAYILLSFISSFTNIAVTWWTTQYLEVWQALVLFLAGQALSGVVGGGMVYQKGFFPKWKLGTDSRKGLREMSKYLLMALSSLIALRLVDFVVRDFAIDRFSLYDTGLWQSVVRLSDSYTMAFTALMGVAYYPKIAALQTKPNQLREYVRYIFSFLVPAIATGLLIFSWNRDFFIKLLFDKEFLAASDLMNYQLIGDFFKLSAWILAYLVSVQARVKLFVFTQFASGGLYLILIFWLLPVMGLKGLTMAHTIRYVLYFLAHLWLFRSYFLSK